MRVAVGDAAVQPKTWNFEAVKARVEQQALADGDLGVVRLAGGVGYVLIGSPTPGSGVRQRGQTYCGQAAGSDVLRFSF